MRWTESHPFNTGRMPVQCHVTNPTFGVPYSHSFIPGTGDNPLTVARKKRNVRNGVLWYQSTCDIKGDTKNVLCALKMPESQGNVVVLKQFRGKTYPNI